MIYHISNQFITVDVCSVGAELHGIFTTGGPSVGWIWDGNPDIWNRRAPVCFPWCGRFRDAWYEEGGRRYETGIHGLLRDMEHTVVDVGPDHITLRAQSGAAELALWPWSFTAETTHRLEGRTVVTTIRGQNTGSTAMPAQIGYHTALRCPFTPGKKPEDYFFRFERAETPTRVVCAGGFVTGETRPIFTGLSEVPITAGMFDEDSINLTGLKSRWVELVERDTGKCVRVGIEGYPCVVLWTKPEIPGFVCIEPWNGLPSRVDSQHSPWDRPTVTRLEPGLVITATQELTING